MPKSKEISSEKTNPVKYCQLFKLVVAQENIKQIITQLNTLVFVLPLQ
jgi:hypothetical protein